MTPEPPEPRSGPATWLECAACHRREGPFASYDEWDAAAKVGGWHVGEEYVLCSRCAGSP